MNLERPLNPDGTELSSDQHSAIREEALRSLYFWSKAIWGIGIMRPETHMAFCRFWEDTSVRNKCGLMPRFHLKSTIKTEAGSGWEIARNPNIRILIANETGAGAEGFVTTIKNHFESNQRLRVFFPEIIPQNFNKTTWSSKALLMPREVKFKEPTVSAFGVGASIVSRHFDLMVFDDLVADEALESPTTMRKTIDWFKRTRGLVDNAYTSRLHLVGTRWALNDVYGYAIDTLRFQEFRRGALVQGPDGPQPFFPEKISMEFLEELISTDPFTYATQFANNPYDAADSDLRPEWLTGVEWWHGPDGDLRYTRGDGTIHIAELSKLETYLHIDPSMGERETSDSTAFVLCGTLPNGCVLVLDAWKKRIDPIKTIDELFEYQEKNAPRITSIEGVAYQKALKYFAEDRARRESRYLRVEDFHPGNKRKKDDRILFTLQPYFRERRIIPPRGPKGLQFREEFLTFGRAHMDILDALSQGPQFWRFPADERTLQRRRKLYEMYENRGSTGYGM